MRVNYTFMIMRVTIAISQEYVQLDQFTNHLLVIRLGETAIGAGIAALVVALVVPRHPRRVLRVAAERHQAAAVIAGHSSAGCSGLTRRTSAHCECLDRMLITGERCLRVILGAFIRREEACLRYRSTGWSGLPG